MTGLSWSWGEPPIWVEGPGWRANCRLTEAEQVERQLSSVVSAVDQRDYAHAADLLAALSYIYRRKISS